jgi:hypothetical protein
MLSQLIRRAAVACTAGTLLLTAACSSSENGSKAETFDTAQSAAALRALGPVRFDGSAQIDGKKQRVEGEADYGRDLVALRFPFDQNGNHAEVEYRRLGTHEWFHRTPATKGVPIGPGLLVYTGPAEPRPWVGVSGSNGDARFTVSAFDPYAFLQTAAKINLPFQRVANGEFEAKPTGQSARTLGLTDVKVAVDDKGVPTRITFDAPFSGHVTYEIDKSTKPVEVVAPPSDRIARSTPLPDAKGTYVQVASGNAGSVPYKVLRAPSSDGGTCWKVQSAPPYTPLPTPRRSGGVCIAALSKGGDINDQIGFPIDATDKTPYEMFGMLLPPGSKASMMLFGGGQKDVPVDAKTGLALYAGPTDPPAALLLVTVPAGTKLYCAPGDVQTPNDVRQLTEADAAALRGQAWNCLEADAIDG